LRILRNQRKHHYKQEVDGHFEWIKKNIGTTQNANQELVNKDIQKMNFWIRLPELRTPITAIRAASEILHDDDDIPEELRKQFCKTSYRSRSFESFDW
jgi:signal transduction histidine kinase